MFLGGGGGTSRNIFKSKLILFESYYSSHTGEHLQLGGGRLSENWTCRRCRELDNSRQILLAVGYP